MSANPAAMSTTRFAFGENWARFLAHVDEARIRGAQTALRDLLGGADLSGKVFLDIGSGSGLSSLAARRAGARVISFDYDPQSVACTEELKRRYFPGDSSWIVMRGSALDTEYLRKLGPCDVVYSWGVLHHTGHMWQAIETAMSPVKPQGLFIIAIYNDQGWVSRYWYLVKRLYNRNAVLRAAMTALHAPYLVAARLAVRALSRKGPLPRGMSPWHDMRDWLGGLPFETARPDDIISFCKARGFVLVRANLVGHRHGCNEFVFQRSAPAR